MGASFIDLKQASLTDVRNIVAMLALVAGEARYSGPYAKPDFDKFGVES